MDMREEIIESATDYFRGQIEKHRMNVELFLRNPVGVAEHSDLIATIEKELASMAEWHDKIAMLNKYF